MPTCFVIQPFNSKFDKKYRDVYKPALEKAGLDPYRVDQDPSTEGVMDSIEQQIRDATICLADITTDNPNVWYELGYAFAAGRSVVMVCSSEREGKLPFDVQHQTVIKYEPESESDFVKLGEEISTRGEGTRQEECCKRGRRRARETSSKRNRWRPNRRPNRPESSGYFRTRHRGRRDGHTREAGKCWVPSSARRSAPGRRTRGSNRYRFWSRAPQSSAKAVRRFRQVRG